MTSTAEQQAQQQLDELSSSFAAWRAGKKHNKEKIPLDLLVQARQLSGALNTATVCKRLGISWEVMRRVEGGSTAPVAAPVFAELQLPHPGYPPALRVEIHTASGAHIVLSNLAGSPSDIVARLLV
ncbi:MAG: hypothetical protein IPN92_20890 [Chromatiaceae bacterium]|jgi:hypothetical protein|nr:hypothetical protein [Chromatiaceae bacterium]